ncbi:MAG: hypothetical protein JXO44_13160, partial [Clostridia bacterium]|nr:hypothetical protein [Clostridia bacterium]
MEEKKRLPRWLKIILWILGIGAGLYLLLIVAVGFLLVGKFSDHTELYGDIVFMEESHHVGETVAMKFVPPEELEGIHRLMWSVERSDVDEREDIDYDECVFYGEDLLGRYSEDELK